MNLARQGAQPVFDHIGVAVKDMDRALKFLSNFDVRLPPPTSPLSKFFKVRDCDLAGVKWALVPSGSMDNAMIEPLEPTREGQLSDFLKTRGDMAVFELGFRVKDIESFYDRVKQMGMTPVDGDGAPLVDKKYFLVCPSCVEMAEQDWIKCFYVNIPSEPGQGPAIEILEYPASWSRSGLEH
jgi:catechol 2,3-dioxygenase-like lactoylglutathione lyase family enzyme